MDHGTTKILFALMRSAIGGEGITKDERSAYSAVMLGDLLKVSAKHDEAHLVALGLMQNGLVPEGDEGIEKYVFRAVYRCERMKYELALTCDALERAGIPFIPLKGSVTRAHTVSDISLRRSMLSAKRWPAHALCSRKPENFLHSSRHTNRSTMSSRTTAV